jgi:hypothetical protein
MRFLPYFLIGACVGLLVPITPTGMLAGVSLTAGLCILFEYFR